MRKLTGWLTIPATLAGGTLASMAADAAQTPLGTYTNDLIVSSSTYQDPGFAAGYVLPNSSGGTTPVTANSSSAFCSTSNCSGNVWNNDTSDPNFGVTSNLILSNVNATTGAVDNSVNVTALAAAQNIALNTSFSSKSEGGINLTPTGTGITFMDYNAAVAQLDISNSNTPAVTEPGNTDTATATYRGVVQLGLADNSLQYSTTNAYNGNNGRAAVLAPNGYYYMVGNAGNGNGGTATTMGTGVQLLTPGASAASSHSVATYTASDNSAKDNNYRGETLYNGVLYVTKGSGNKGTNTVYQVNNVGGNLPTSGGTLSVLPGFNSTLNSSNATPPHPFGVWFADPNTLYVADEGAGVAGDFTSSGGKNVATAEAGGLQKYSLVGGTWKLDYELQGSLIGATYTVAGTGSLTGDSLTTTTDGLRNLTGKINGDGTVTLYAVTSTEGSVLGDAGADPNKLVAITDNLSAKTLPTGEDFTTLENAQLGQVLRGVAVAPVPLPAAAWLLLSGLGGLGSLLRRRRTV